VRRSGPAIPSFMALTAAILVQPYQSKALYEFSPIGHPARLC
jgi:hypothetical protein